MEMNKAVEKLNKELKKEQAALAALEKKRAEIDESIKEKKNVIAGIKENIEQEKLDILNAAAKKQGMNVDDLIAMLVGNASNAAAPAQSEEAADNDEETGSADFGEE